MSRITAPASKLARAMSTTSKVSRPSQMVASAAAAPRMVQTQERNNFKHNRSFHPTPSSSARMDTSTIDFCKMPNVAAFDGPDTSLDPFARLRVPLAPDNFVTHHQPEVVVEPLAKPEIVVIAARPGSVMPAALTAEVDSFEYEGVSLAFAQEDTGRQRNDHAGGMLQGIWTGLIDDVNSSGGSGGGKVVL